MALPVCSVVWLRIAPAAVFSHVFLRAVSVYPDATRGPLLPNLRGTSEKQAFELNLEFFKPVDPENEVCACRAPARGKLRSMRKCACACGAGPTCVPFAAPL